jgi:diguanylate cyclase (GGDEF)-like protein/PAS domain S-box-containing protein
VNERPLEWLPVGLRLKTALIIAVAVSILVAGLYFWLANRTEAEFLRLEGGELQQNLERAGSAVEFSLSSLEDVTLDWAVWDDAHGYLRGFDDDFPRRSLTPMAFSLQNLDLVVYQDTLRTTIFTLERTPSGNYQDARRNTRPFTNQSNWLWKHKTRFIVESGLLVLGEEFYFVARAPVIPSSHVAEPAGYLIMARKIDKAAVAKLAKLTRLDLSVYSNNNPATIPEGGLAALQELQNGKSHVVQILSNDKIAGFCLLSDREDIVPFVMRAEMPRTLWQQGQTTLRWLLFSLVAAGLAFFFLALWLLEHNVLRRLLLLAQQLAGIAQHGNPTDRVRIAGNDEISGVAGGINRGLERIEAAQGQLRLSEERYALALAGANDGLWDWDIASDEFYLSRRGWHILGCEAEEPSAFASWRRLVHPEDREHFERQLEQHLNATNPQFEIEHRVKASDGQFRSLLMRGVAVRDLTGKPVRLAGSLTDTTAREMYFDSLTGLPSRRLFLERLARMIEAQATHFVVIHLEIARFQVIQDSLGHLVSEHLLRQISRRLGSLNLLAARVGNQEFAILITIDHQSNANDQEHALKIANEIKYQLEAPFDIEGRTFFLASHMGLVLHDTNGVYTPEDYLRAADIAMLRARASGFGIQFFDQDMQTALLRRIDIEGDLRLALKNDEISLHYQPLISLKTGKIVGFEALARWTRRGQFVSPAEFVAVAEEAGLIHDLSRVVLKRACREALTWAEPVQLSVNVSSSDLARPDIVALVKEILRDSGLAATRLCLEITEGVLASSPEIAATIIELRQAGIHIHLDDFGTGYSSFSYLQRFKLDALKIDRAFVIPLEHEVVEESALKIIEAVVALGQALDLEVVAEGIENQLQAERLRLLGCDIAQGYHFSRPVALERVNALFGQSLALSPMLLPPVPAPLSQP